MMTTIPRLIVSGLSGGAGKTMLSLGLARAFARQSLRIRTFKKGPDYIDAAWLALAAKSPSANLDPFFTPGAALRQLFVSGSNGYDLALVEGNRGLFDGLDLAGSCATAEVSRLLRAPVLLVIDCTKMTRTVAAVVKGCLDFEKDVHIGGVICNRAGNSRHGQMVRRAVEELSGVPVLGVLPRRKEAIIQERHMGLCGADEQAEADAHLDALAGFVADNVDLQAVHALAQSAPPLAVSAECATASPSSALSSRPRIGYAFDAAFWFYYRENLEALERAGARLVPVSLLSAAPWPEIDGLYLGGGLPELHAEALSGNIAVRERVAGLSAAGIPVYAECGGFLFLSKSITIGEKTFPMAGVFSCSVEFCDRPQGLGYVEAEVVKHNPYHPRGMRFRGHEFHFSRCVFPEKDGPGLVAGERHSAGACVLRLHKGRGMANDSRGAGYDGLISSNTYASYTHIYAPALPYWAPAFVALCR